MKFCELLDNITFNTKVCVHDVTNKTMNVFVCNMAGEYPNKHLISNYRVESISVEDNILYVEVGE